MCVCLLTINSFDRLCQQSVLFICQPFGQAAEPPKRLAVYLVVALCDDLVDGAEDPLFCLGRFALAG